MRRSNFFGKGEPAVKVGTSLPVGSRGEEGLLEAGGRRDANTNQRSK
jgi:hypothetical protein